MSVWVCMCLFSKCLYSPMSSLLSTKEGLPLVEHLDFQLFQSGCSVAFQSCYVYSQRFFCVSATSWGFFCGMLMILLQSLGGKTVFQPHLYTRCSWLLFLRKLRLPRLRATFVAASAPERCSVPPALLVPWRPRGPGLWVETVGIPGRKCWKLMKTYKKHVTPTMKPLDIPWTPLESIPWTSFWHS